MSSCRMMLCLSKAPWKGSNAGRFLRHLSSNKSVLFTNNSITSYEQQENAGNLFSDIQNAKSVSRILNIVRDNYRKMNDKESVFALKEIFALQKNGMSDVPARQLLNHPDFEKICRVLKKHSGVVNTNDTVDALKVLSFLNVPCNSTIVQVLFQIVRQNLNSFSIPQILFFDMLLRKFEATPLTNALKIALPLVFELNITTRLNSSNPIQIMECLRYATKHRLSLETINFIVKKLEEYDGEFDGTAALSIIISICDLPRDYLYENIINRASTDLVVKIDEIPIGKIELVLNRLVHRFSNKFSFYYQEVLFDTCANLIINRNIGYDRSLAVVRNMARTHHVHTGLLDYISSYIYNNPSTEKNPVDIYSIVVALVLTAYKPVHWDHLKGWIKSAKHLADKDKMQIIWVRFAAALCCLDIYKIDVLTRGLAQNYMEHLLNKKFRSNFENYFLIWQCITSYKPDLTELLPSNLEPKDLVKTGFQVTEFPFEGALKEGLGGEQYVMTNLFSKLGVQIDHAIVFENGSPVQVENNVEFVEDIRLENSSQQLVLIWRGDFYAYTINTKELRLGVQKTLSILEESLKCNVVPVNLESWTDLNDFEKVPYLVQKIKEKLNLDVLESAV